MSQGNLEKMQSQGKVREFQISLEMVWLWQSSEKERLTKFYVYGQQT